VWDIRNCLSLNRRERPRWRRAHFDPRSALRARIRIAGEGRGVQGRRFFELYRVEPVARAASARGATRGITASGAVR
jgi:hypothetical protein